MTLECRAHCGARSWSSVFFAWGTKSNLVLLLIPIDQLWTDSVNRNTTLICVGYPSRDFPNSKVKMKNELSILTPLVHGNDRIKQAVIKYEK